MPEEPERTTRARRAAELALVRVCHHYGGTRTESPEAKAVSPSPDAWLTTAAHDGCTWRLPDRGLAYGKPTSTNCVCSPRDLNRRPSAARRTQHHPPARGTRRPHARQRAT